MTPDEVQCRVDHLRTMRYDDAATHREEDSIHQDVLQAIAGNTCTDPIKCATIALTTENIDFARWYE